MARDDQGLGQGIFNTVVQIGTAISLALAATVAHAGGVTADASKMELLHGYRNCFWFSVGMLSLPFISVWFLKGRRASESSEEEQNNKHNRGAEQKREGESNGEQKLETSS